MMNLEHVRQGGKDINVQPKVTANRIAHIERKVRKNMQITDEWSCLRPGLKLIFEKRIRKDRGSPQRIIIHDKQVRRLCRKYLRQRKYNYLWKNDVFFADGSSWLICGASYWGKYVYIQNRENPNYSIRI